MTSVVEHDPIGVVEHLGLVAELDGTTDPPLSDRAGVDIVQRHPLVDPSGIVPDTRSFVWATTCSSTLIVASRSSTRALALPEAPIPARRSERRAFLATTWASLTETQAMPRTWSGRFLTRESAVPVVGMGASVWRMARPDAAALATQVQERRARVPRPSVRQGLARLDPQLGMTHGLSLRMRCRTMTIDRFRWRYRRRVCRGPPYHLVRLHRPGSRAGLRESPFVHFRERDALPRASPGRDRADSSPAPWGQGTARRSLFSDRQSGAQAQIIA